MACKTLRLDDNDNIDGSAKCGHDVRLGARATIGSNVRIGVLSELGNDLTVGPDAQIGEDVLFGNNVRIGQGACVGDKTVFRDKSVVPDNGRGYRDGATRQVIIENAPDGYTYNLVGGKCQISQM